MVDAYGYLGIVSSNNSATITGAGSVWNNTATLTVGNGGSGNTLTITNGGEVIVGNLLAISARRRSNNSINISSGQLIVSNGTINVDAAAGRSAQLNISGGTVLAMQLLATNANGVINFNGGTLVSQSTTISNGQDFNIGKTGGNATFIANGGTHSFQDDLYIGNSSSANQFVISNTATVVNNNGYLGYNTGTSNNSVTVTDAWLGLEQQRPTGSWLLRIGDRLTITNGGTMYSAGGIIGTGQ